MQTRLLAVQLASELFARSGLFRMLMSTNFTELLENAIGFRQSKPLPDPQEDAKELRDNALESLETWNEDFGVSLPQARHLFNKSSSMKTRKAYVQGAYSFSRSC